MDIAAFYMVSYGLYVVSSMRDGKPNGQIANTVFQITPDPPTIAVSINRQNLTWEYIKHSGVFTVSVLSTEAPMTFIGTFGFKSGRDIDKFEKCKFKNGEKTGAPIVLDHTLSFLEAKVVNSVDVGSHTIFIGEVVDGAVVGEGEPMTYAYYHQVKKGKTPEKAATYVKQDAGGGGGTPAGAGEAKPAAEGHAGRRGTSRRRGTACRRPRGRARGSPRGKPRGGARGSTRRQPARRSRTG